MKNPILIRYLTSLLLVAGFFGGQTAHAQDARQLDQLYPDHGYRLLQNRPNPCMEMTTIEFVLPEDTYVKMTLFNYQGQQVMTLIDNWYHAGNHTLKWTVPSDLSPGMYFYRMQTPAVTLTRKLHVVR